MTQVSLNHVFVFHGTSLALPHALAPLLRTREFFFISSFVSCILLWQRPFESNIFFIYCLPECQWSYWPLVQPLLASHSGALYLEGQLAGRSPLEVRKQVCREIVMKTK